MFDQIHDLEDALQRPAQQLVHLQMLKAAKPASGEEDYWTFHGIASDEGMDVEGDTLLKKALDVTYANTRGYVNWDHGRGPEDQIGFLTKCEILTPSRIAELRKSFPNISDKATAYVSGELYKHVARAKTTRDMLKSASESSADTYMGPGLSLDGAVARDRKSGGLIKAFVRGVAITPQPANMLTTARLKKSLAAYNELEGIGGNLSPEAVQLIAGAVVDEMRKSAAPLLGNTSMNRDQAILWLLQKRPHWSYELASKVVRYTMQNSARGA